MAERTAVTIGFFDGVHRGHQALLQRVREAAAARGLEAVAVTFDLHSLEVLHGQGLRPTLLTTDEKVERLRAGGMRRVEVLHFTPEFAAQSGEQFVHGYLHATLAAAHIVVGHDFRFGHRRSSGSADLARIGAELGIEVDVLRRIDVDGVRVSSSLLREMVADGQVAEVAPLLGRPYSLRGTVVEGRRLGRTIGFPTANLAVDPRKLLPARGVYVVRAEADGPRLGMLNIGTRPTVDAGSTVTVEVHLLDFEGDLYGHNLELTFVARLRGEQRFAGVEELRGQLIRDREATRLAGRVGPT